MSPRPRGSSLDLVFIRAVLKISGYALLIGVVFATVMLVLTRVFHVKSSQLADLVLGLFN